MREARGQNQFSFLFLEAGADGADLSGRKRRPPAAKKAAAPPVRACLLDVPGDLLLTVIQPLRPAELAAVARTCTSLRRVVKAHPFFVGWLDDDASWDWNRSSFCAAVARGGSLELLQWARSHDCPWGWRTGWEAFTRGDVPMLEWLVKHGYLVEVGHKLSENAAIKGNLPLLKWLHMLGYNIFLMYEREYDHPYPEVAESGHLPVLMWLQTLGVKLDLECIAAWAAAGGQIHVLEWVYATGHSWALHGSDGESCGMAAENGYVHALIWLQAHGVEVVVPRFAESAAENGQMYVLAWLLAQGLDLIGVDDLCTKAAQCGQLTALEWLWKLGCPLDKVKCIQDAERIRRNRRQIGMPTVGHEYVLDWLREGPLARPHTRTHGASARSLARYLN